jgi:hypothetical protein
MNATIATTLSMNSAPFTRGLQEGERGLTSFGREVQQLEQRNAQFSKTTAQAANNVAASTQRMATAGGGHLRQFSYAFEDFAISASTGGIGMGLRGATNNINSVLATMGKAGAAGAIMVTGLTVGISYIEKMRAQARGGAEDMTKFIEQMNRLQGAAEKQVEFRQMLRKAPDLERTKEEIQNRRDMLEQNQARLKAITEMRKKEMGARLNQPANFWKDHWGGGVEGVFGGGGPLGMLPGWMLGGGRVRNMDASFEKDKKANDEAIKLLEDRRRIEAEIVTLRQRAAGLTREQNQTEFFQAREEQRRDIFDQFKQAEEMKAAAQRERQAIIDRASRDVLGLASPEMREKFAARKREEAFGGLGLPDHINQAFEAMNARANAVGKTRGEEDIKRAIDNMAGNLLRELQKLNQSAADAADRDSVNL